MACFSVVLQMSGVVMAPPIPSSSPAASSLRADVREEVGLWGQKILYSRKSKKPNEGKDLREANAGGVEVQLRVLTICDGPHLLFTLKCDSKHSKIQK